nr:MAG TPA: hypothetical protein [Caudoviricetes sp.]
MERGSGSRHIVIHPACHWRQGFLYLPHLEIVINTTTTN